MRRFGDQSGSLMYGLLLGLVLSIGVGLSIPMVANYYYGMEFDPDNPLSGGLKDKVYQGKAIADMRSMATSITGFYLKYGRLPDKLQEIDKAGYIENFSPADPWGNDWVYRSDNRHFVLVSLGADGRRGPDAHVPWDNDQYDPDLIMKDGAWIQAPERPGLRNVGQSLQQKKEASEGAKTAIQGMIGRR